MSRKGLHIWQLIPAVAAYSRTKSSLSYFLLSARLFNSHFNVMAEKTQLDRAIEEIKRRRHRGGPVPDIDFTQYKLEDGTIVSTQERVIKEVFSFGL